MALTLNDKVLTEAFGANEGTALRIKQAAMVILGIAALAIFAKIKIPMWPVPVTMGTFAVLTIGAAYGPRLGFATILGYMIIGALGFDVFAGSSVALAMLIGNALIYVPGLLWLGQLYGWDKPILEWGLTPFLIGDGLKLALAALLVPGLWKLLGNARS